METRQKSDHVLRWWPTTGQLQNPPDVERAMRRVLTQQYALQDEHNTLQSRVAAMPMPTPMGGAPPGSGPTDTQLLGLYVQPVDPKTLANGTVLTWDAANRVFRFLPGGGSGTVTEANILLSDVTTDDVSIVKHGFAPKAPNDATKFLNGLGLYSSPAGTAIPTPVEAEVVAFVGVAGTLAHTPSVVAGYTKVKLYRNGLRQLEGGGNDFTRAGANITLSLAAGGLDVFQADYYQ